MPRDAGDQCSGAGMTLVALASLPPLPQNWDPSLLCHFRVDNPAP